MTTKTQHTPTPQQELQDLESQYGTAFIVRAVNAHGELRRRLMLTAASFHHLSNHGGYSKDCTSVVCRQNYEAIANAEGRHE